MILLNGARPASARLGGHRGGELTLRRCLLLEAWGGIRSRRRGVGREAWGVGREGGRSVEKRGASVEKAGGRSRSVGRRSRRRAVGREAWGVGREGGRSVEKRGAVGGIRVERRDRGYADQELLARPVGTLTREVKWSGGWPASPRDAGARRPATAASARRRRSAARGSPGRPSRSSARRTPRSLGRKASGSARARIAMYSAVHGPIPGSCKQPRAHLGAVAAGVDHELPRGERARERAQRLAAAAGPASAAAVRRGDRAAAAGNRCVSPPVGLRPGARPARA